MKRIKRFLFLVLTIVVVFGFSFSSCKKGRDAVLKMATTTSTDNTGLLDYLKPAFKSDEGIDLQWVAVGTGKALELGKNCDVDLLFVHAPQAEKEYVDKGYGINRTQVMFNDFIIIGPGSDPAKIKGKPAVIALKAIADNKAVFASRGDNSGTNKKEIALWKGANLPVPDKQKWYIQTGQGMLNTINIASERNGYTLTDRGTYIKYESNNKGGLSLLVLVEGDKTLRNQYSVIAVNPDKCKKVKYDMTKKFILWITSDKIQKLIGDFKLIGKPLFTPNAGKK